jgi:hypothetical protein
MRIFRRFVDHLVGNQSWIHESTRINPNTFDGWANAAKIGNTLLVNVSARKKACPFTSWLVGCVRFNTLISLKLC